MTRYEKLSVQFDEYKTQSEKQINALSLELRIYKTTTYVAVPTAIISIMIIIGMMMGW